MYQLYQVYAGSVDLKFYFNHHIDKFFFFVTFLKPMRTDTYTFLILYCLLLLYVPIVWPKLDCTSVVWNSCTSTGPPPQKKKA